MAGRVKEYYRYPAMEAFHKGCVRRYFADVLYEMVDDPSTDSIVSWSQDGKSFIFWDQDKFCSDVLPKFGLSTSPTFFVRLTDIYVSNLLLLSPSVWIFISLCSLCCSVFVRLRSLSTANTHTITL